MLNKTLAAVALAGGLMAPAIASAASPAIVTTDLNIRTGPGAEYQRFGTIPSGTRISVEGCLNGYNWCDVSWAGERGWVSASYLAYSGQRYNRRPISSVGASIGVSIIGFEPRAYHGRYYRDRSWYRDRYIDRGDRRDDRREVRQERREDRRDVREERRDVQDARRDVRQERGDVRDTRRELRDARQDGENTRPIRRELREERRDVQVDRRELRQERRELRDERRDLR